MFRKVLVANRGEIACRVMRTAQHLGVRTVAIYSEADVNAMHVALADEAYCVGAPEPQASYLNINAIIDICIRSGAQAVHPGYGFLSENPAFARACEENHITFIGPPVSAIEAMGSKAKAKQIMAQANVPLVPGYQGSDQEATQLRQHATVIGFPLLIKASAGGGGKGMRLVYEADEFNSALRGAKREGLQSFGDDTIILEKYLLHARHVEVQVFCDRYGNGVYLGDRDCSMQRRHQKILEEAPAPGIPAPIRQQMGEAAVRAALAINYQGAGTIEFLLDENQHFYFMEMNTRLQVEHPVTEQVTGQDLVEWQFRVANGEQLPLKQHDISINGHAIEARIYAEDCSQGFIPSSGTIEFLSWPLANNQLRIDTGVRESDVISRYYDPMIAKLIVHGEDRAQALNHLEKNLSQCHIGGLQTNLHFLSSLQANPVFQECRFHTAYVDEHLDELIQVANDFTTNTELLAWAAMAFWLQRSAKNNGKNGALQQAWYSMPGWRMNLARKQLFNIECAGTVEQVLLVIGDAIAVHVGDQVFSFDGTLSKRLLHLNTGNNVLNIPYYFKQDELTLFTDNRARRFSLWTAIANRADSAGQDALIRAPMHGRLLELLVEAGKTVDAGDSLAVVEAMKMEHTLRAPFAGKVKEIYFTVNDTVENNVAILELEANDPN